MTAAPMSFPLKQGKDDCLDDNDDEENEDSNSVSSLPQPSILDKDLFEFADPRDEFLRLTSMVRRVYFSYLQKSIIGNYNTCCLTKDKDVPKSELKKFASRMELCAVKASLETSLYRQTMLKMISDIKGSTSSNKVHKKLMMFLEAPPNRANVAIQTNEDYFYDKKITDSSYLTKDVHIQSAFVTSNFDENQSATTEPPKDHQQKNLDERITELLKNEARVLPKIETESLEPNCEKIPKIRVKRDDGYNTLSMPKSPVNDKNCKINTIVAAGLPRKNDNDDDDDNDPIIRESEASDNQMYNDMRDIFGNDEPIAEPLRNDDEASQDSLMQHLEDMFCESDDSSDLMTLIEKHSGVTKANVDSEIGKMCPVETQQPVPQSSSLSSLSSSLSSSSSLSLSLFSSLSRTTGALKSCCPVKQIENMNDSTITNKRKLSFGNYKKMKKRAMGEPETPPHEETPEERQNRKICGIWFVERVHQVTKLRTKMMDLSVKNYRRHGRLCAKFIQLFGEPDEEEMMPQSPIHIEKHLTACKERIAPWVVKYLMPYYTKKIIKNRLLFKAVAKHIADMLIIENTFPEEDCVEAYVTDYFRNKTCIKAESDIYI